LKLTAEGKVKCEPLGAVPVPIDGSEWESGMGDGGWGKKRRGRNARIPGYMKTSIAMRLDSISFFANAANAQQAPIPTYQH